MPRRRKELSEELRARLPPAVRERLELEELEVTPPVRGADKLTRRLVREKAGAAFACEALLRLPPAERLERVRRSRGRSVSRPLAEEILKRCRVALFEKPAEGLALAELAREVTLRLARWPERCGGRTGLADLQARCLAHLGNACRVNGLFTEAEKAFAAAFAQLQEGSGEVLIEAELLSLRASLLLDRWRYPEAMDDLRRAEDLYRLAAEPHLQGRVLLKMAATLRQQGRAEQAISAYFAAFRQLEEEKEPAVSAAAWANLSVCFSELGRFGEAQQVLRAARTPLARCPTGNTIHLTFAWAKGMATAGLGILDESEEAYDRAAEGFRAIGDTYRRGLVSLELALVYQRQGRYADMEALAEETYEALEAVGVAEEALTALLLFVDAAKRRRLSEAVVTFAAAELRRHAASEPAKGSARPSEKPYGAQGQDRPIMEAFAEPEQAAETEPKPTEAEKIGWALRWLRRYRGMDQPALARAAGVTQGMLSAWETGAKQPRSGTLHAVLRAMDSSFADLEAALATVRLDGPEGRPVPRRRGAGPGAHPKDHELLLAAIDDSPGAQAEAAAARALLRLLRRRDDREDPGST